MTSDDRPAGPPLSSSIATPAAALPAEPVGTLGTAGAIPPTEARPAGLQSAAFAVGRHALVLTAITGEAGLSVTTDGGTSLHTVPPASLAAWADNAARLLALEPVGDARERAELRAPFLMDAANNPTIALGCAIDEHSVVYHVYVTRPLGDADAVTVERGLVETLLEAAGGAAVVAAGRGTPVPRVGAA